MMQAATLADCGRDREQVLILEQKLKTIERRKKNGKKISIEGKKT